MDTNGHEFLTRSSATPATLLAASVEEFCHVEPLHFAPAFSSIFLFTGLVDRLMIPSDVTPDHSSARVVFGSVGSPGGALKIKQSNKPQKHMTQRRTLE